MGQVDAHHAGYLGLLFAVGVIVAVYGYHGRFARRDFLLAAAVTLFSFQAFDQFGRDWSGAALSDIHFWLNATPAVALVLVLFSFVPLRRIEDGRRETAVLAGLSLVSFSIFAPLFAILRGS